VNRKGTRYSTPRKDREEPNTVNDLKLVTANQAPHLRDSNTRKSDAWNVMIKSGYRIPSRIG
jgi:hypothetical protein